MGRLITNPPKAVIRIRIAQNNYKAVLALATTVHASLTADVSDFPAPNPTLVQLGTDITALEAALAALGTKANKGSHADVLNAQAATLTVRNDLVALAAYVNNIISGSASPASQNLLLSRSGFASKSKKSLVPKTQLIRSRGQINSKQYPFTLRRVSWKRPLGLIKGLKLTGYNIYIQTGAGTPTFLVTQTKTNYTFNSVPPANSQLIIAPLNARGEGNSFKVPIR